MRLKRDFRVFPKFPFHKRKRKIREAAGQGFFDSLFSHFSRIPESEKEEIFIRDFIFSFRKIKKIVRK